MKAYSYIRFSTDSQTWGDSERRQEQQAKDYCKRHGFELAGTSFADRGVSGWRGKNRKEGAFADLLKVAKPGDRILIEDNDRFSREDPITALVGLRDVVQKGIIVAFLKTGVEVTSQNFNDASVLFPNFFQAYLGNQENEKKSFRIGEVWTAKRSRLASEPMTAKCVGWLKLSTDRKRFEEIPDRVKIVRSIFEKVRAGQGANGIAKEFNKAGVKPFGKSDHWHPSYIKKILENRAVIGEFTPGMVRGGGKRKMLDPIPGYYPAVVSKELFASVQQMRKGRNNYRGRTSINVFSKLAFDKQTGSPMVYVNKNREKGWHYLVASDAVHGVNGAKYHAWQYDDFRESFLAVCHKAALAKAETITEDNGVETKRMEIADVQERLDRAAEFLLSGHSATIAAKVRELEAKKAALSKDLEEMESSTNADPVRACEVDWKDTEALRENLRATVKRITVDAGARWFRAEFLDGRIYELQIGEDGAEIRTPDKPKKR